MQSTVATPRSGRGEGHLLDLDREAAGVVADEDQDRLPVAFPGAADGAGGAPVPTGLRVSLPFRPTNGGWSLTRDGADLAAAGGLGCQ